MKSLLAILLLACLAPAQTNPPAAPPAAPSAESIPADQENVRKARALLDQMIQALGGQAYLKIQDISQEGRTYSFYHGRPNSYGIIFWRFYKYPDKERVELTKKRDVIYVNNGDKGYEITYKGTRAQEPKDVADTVRRRHYALDWVLRHWLSEPGVALFYEGHSVAEQKPVEQVTVMNAHNEGVTLYIDVDTHLPVKKTFSWRDPTDKERNIEDEVYDNFRPIQGVMTPLTLTRFYNGDMSNQRFLSSVSYDKGLADTMFQAQVTYNPGKP
ncbi:MAG TPA: hypothetical protein VMO80_14595 [Terriglobales bacterium]|jgi:hypothetical protein|nr:hypothetical protein [Terriglobales bacterium]